MHSPCLFLMKFYQSNHYTCVFIFEPRGNPLKIDKRIYQCHRNIYVLTTFGTTLQWVNFVDLSKKKNIRFFEQFTCVITNLSTMFSEFARSCIAYDAESCVPGRNILLIGNDPRLFLLSAIHWGCVCRQFVNRIVPFLSQATWYSNIKEYTRFKKM